jgi:hypothetical protein
MKKELWLLALIASLLTCSKSWAWPQNWDRSDLFFPTRHGLMHLSYGYNHYSAFNNAPGEKVAYHDIDFRAMFPVVTTTQFAFLLGAKYDLHHFRLNNVTNYFTGDSKNAHMISLLMDGAFFFGDDWMLNLSFIPTISSDLKGIGSHDFQWLGGVIAGWIFSDSASMLFGIYASKEFWEYYPVPILGFIVRPEGSFFDMEVILPQYMRFNFKVADFCKLFAQGEFDGYVWDVEGDGTVPDHFLKMIDTHAGAGAKFKIIPGLFIEVWGGINPYRKYEFRDRANAEFKSRQKVGWFAETTISLGQDLFGFK